MAQEYFIGVDVGTGSARAALVSSTGEVVAESTYNSTTWRDEHDANIFEQSSTQIWNCISKACQDVLRETGIDKSLVKGIGFDATCSLTVADISTGEPISVTPGSWDKAPVVNGEDGVRDIILWADHRAHEEAKLINSTGVDLLNYVGGTMSLEMEMPKILWLKNHMPADKFAQCQFWDLPDWLTFRATDDLARSNCSLTCKCSYVSPDSSDNAEGWSTEFMRKIGLDAFVENDFKQVGGQPGKGGVILTAGQPVGKGLSARAANDLGLVEGTAVGSAVIDAYAGWIGTVAAKMEGQTSTSIDDSRHRLAAIAGTSTCHIVQSADPVFVPGVWGPYQHAVFPGMWMNEGGQSSTGQLLDFMVDTHPAADKLKQQAKDQGTNHFSLLTELLKKMAQDKKVPFMSALTKDLQLYPDLHGNRSPLADNEMRGMLVGMKLDKNVSDLALKYYATGEAIALQTRQIIDEMNAKGHDVTAIFMSGGLVKNEFLMQLIANICNLPVQLPSSSSASVVLGSAMLGAAAAAEAKKGPIASQEDAQKRSFANKGGLWDIMTQMTKSGSTIQPHASAKELKLLQVKYDNFLEMIELQRKWRRNAAAALED